MMGFHHPEGGFTSMIQFGRQFEPQSLHEVRAMDRYLEPGAGYDGQFYAQLAVRPNPWDPELQRALDNPWYRAGRILPSLVASGLAFGNPELAVHLYAIQYLVVWGAFALVLLLWFPVGTFWNFLCWFGCLFSGGAIMAVCRALPDAWALLLVSAGTYLWFERGSRWGALLVGLSALAKETAVMVAAAFLERVPREVRDGMGMAANIAAAVAPAFVWYLVIRFTGGTFVLGGETFGLPFAGLVDRMTAASSGSLEGAVVKLSVMVSSAVQAGFFLFRWRPSDWRWRVGIAHVAFMALLGAPVWEGYPIAAGRVLSPMLFVFNLSVPRSLGFWPVLILGNLSVLSGLHMLQHPPS
jgi:hypothetical protein